MIMSFAMLIVLAIYVLIIYFLIKLQVGLSRQKQWWKGLIIPLIFLGISIVSAVGNTTYTTSAKTQVFDDQGNLIKEVVNQSLKPSPANTVLAAMPVLIVMNIPTLAFLGIYGAQRNKLKPHTELNKMNIQDL